MSRSILVRQLEEARECFCGEGTRKVKLRLNKCTDPIGRAFRIALEIEDCSTQGKKYRGDWSNHNYAKKSALIQELITLCKVEGWAHGKQPSGSYYPRWIVYFDLPFCEQISFHTNIKTPEAVPDYAREWDGKRNSTLAKLEVAITTYFTKDQLVFELI